MTILKLILYCFSDLIHLIRCCIFSFLQILGDFLSSFPNKAKSSTFYLIFQLLTLFGMLLKNQEKKPQHLRGRFKSKKHSKLIFRSFVFFLACLNKKWQKHVFCDFLKNCDFWSKFNITNVFLVGYVQYKMGQK